MEYINRSCFICEYKSFKGSEVCAPLPAELLSFDQLKAQWNGFFNDEVKTKAFFSYHRCSNCQVLFCPTFFSGEQLSSLYENMADNTANVELQLLKKTQRGYFQCLNKHLQAVGGDYFEMGPDIGLFTENVRDAKKFDHFWLAEPNKAVWTTLKEKLNTQPHYIFSDLLIDDPITTNTVGAAVMIHVLDHLLDPLETLCHLRSKMKKNAILLTVTHDESSLLAKALNHRWPAYCLQHPQLYNPTSINYLLKKAGFNVLEIKKSYNHFPLGYLLNHLLWAAGIRKMTFPSMNSLQIPLKLGNIITVAST